MSDIRETISNFTKNVTKSSGDLFKTTRLSMAVTSEQTVLKNLYQEIGKKVHEIYQYGGSLGKFFDEKYLEIEASEKKIEELKEQISQIKGVRECIKCGKTAERTAEFCPKCGIRLAAASPDERAATTEQAPPVDPSQPAQHPAAAQHTPMPASSAPHVPVSSAPPTMPAAAIPTPAPDTPADPSTRRCRVCGMENDITTKFCLSCGRIVD